MKLPANAALEKIKNVRLAGAYWLIGKEIYWRDQVWEALREAVGISAGLPGITELDLRQDSLDKVLEVARTSSLLAPRQLILVRNAQAVPSRRRPARDPRAGEAKGFSGLAAYLADPNPSTILVLEVLDVDLESDDWREKEKAKAKLEAVEGLGETILLSSPSLGQAVELVRQEAAQRGKKIAPQTAEQLVLAADRNMARIRLEIEKLSLYNAKKEIIELEDLNLLAVDLVAQAGLSMSEALATGNTEKALETLSGLFRSGRYAPLIIFELARFLRQLILLKENQVRDARQAAKVLWASRLPAPQSALPGLVRKARRTDLRHLLQGLQQAYQTDLALRSGPPSHRILLEKFLLDLTMSLRSA